MTQIVQKLCSDPSDLSRNNAGDLATVTYNDGTLGTTYTYDRRGRRVGVETTDGTTVTDEATLGYDDAGQPLSESHTAGILSGLSTTAAFNNSLQRTSITLSGAASSYSAGYTFDTAGRLLTATEGPSTATYDYLANSVLIGHITFAQNGQTRMVTSKQFDFLNRLQSISSAPSGPAASVLPASFSYLLNSANQRARCTLADGSYWIYTYDSLGQVTSGNRFWRDGTPVAGQQFQYGFDHIGNRKTTGGRASAQGQYTANRLNQYSQRTNPRVLELIGVANPTASVTVNSHTADRHGEYFHDTVTVAGTGSAYPSVPVASQFSPGDSQSGNMFLPPATEYFGHDLDGNLTNDGRWAFTWDGENRLIKIEPSGTVTAPTGSRRQLEFAYDHQGRRIWQRTTNLETSTAVERRFVYDGWNLLAVLDVQTTPNILNSFVWGTDLSGSFQGAGGIGGLLRVTCNGPQTTNAFVAFDGNGNVSALRDASDGLTVAQYEYGPFGELLRATGPLAKSNPLRFSTKYQDDETHLLYYGYRYYCCSTGRWLGRDPADESGGLNLYCLVSEDPIDAADATGPTEVKKDAKSITREQAQNGIWGWTDLESTDQREAKLKLKKRRCICVVKKKPEMVFTILVQTARKGRQAWTEDATFDAVSYPSASVYVGSGLAKLSQRHEEKRFQAWKKALTSYWPAHYENPAASLTAPTCPELAAKIAALYQQAVADWETSAEAKQLVNALLQIGEEVVSPSRWVRRSGFGSVSVNYDVTN
jgi:RHS repeat-associated protein